MVFVIATRNRHKAQEIQAMLPGTHVFLTLTDFLHPPEIVEDAATFAGNALKKASGLAEWLRQDREARSRLPDKTRSFVLADDSGLEVDALGGAPGVWSARFAASDVPQGSGNSSDAENNAKLLNLLKSVPAAKRTARFRCLLALVPLAPAQADLAPQLFDGVCEGRIGFAPQGQGGFGYDPLFIPDTFQLTFAELGEAQKNQLSHRYRALEKLKAYLETFDRAT